MEELKSVISQLEDIAKHPSRQLDCVIKSGKKAVGCLPVYCPEELVYASGMIPFGIWGVDGLELKNSKHYFPAFICSVLQSALELGMKGVFDRLEAVMIPVLCDSLKCMTQNFKCGVPNVEVLPVIHPQNRKTTAGREFLRSQYQKLANRLGEISGTPLTDATLADAVSVYNAHRLEMRKFSENAAKHPELISPSQRSAVIKSAFFMDKAEHTAAVSKINALLSNAPEGSFDGKRIIVTGILADSPAILECFANNGLAVVGDDVAAESRQFNTDVPVTPDPLDGLVWQFSNMEGCSVLYDPEKKRVGMIVRLAQERKADGVVVLLTKFCDPEEFDYPFLKKAFDAAGIPSVVVEIDRQMVNFGQLETAIEAFRDML